MRQVRFPTVSDQTTTSLDCPEVLLAIFCVAENSTLFDHPAGDSTWSLYDPFPKAAVSSSSAINITPEVIDHGYRPETTSTRPFLVCYFSGVTTGCAPGIDWAAMERLRTKRLISDPVGKAKSVVFTDEGLRQSEALWVRAPVTTKSKDVAQKRLAFVLDWSATAVTPVPETRGPAPQRM
jgi:Domain of unknown function (DUF6429)